MDVTFPVAAPQAPGCELIRLIGMGASAQVWLARQGSAEVALKCFAPADLAGAEGTMAVHGSAIFSPQALEQEAQILSAFRHEHLVRVHEVLPLAGDWSGGAALVLDYAAGGSMADVLAHRCPLSPGEVVTITTPVLQALAYLHSRSVAHGDVSAANIVFLTNGKPLLTDLGAAKLRGGRRSESVLGTLGCVDPALGAPGESSLAAECAADVYAVCALAWRALSGSYPGNGRGKLTLPEEVPAELARVLASGLSPKPAQRPSAAELAVGIFAAAPAAPVDLMPSVHPSVLPQLPTRRALRNELQPASQLLASQRPASQRPGEPERGDAAERRIRADSRGRAQKRRAERAGRTQKVGRVQKREKAPRPPAFRKYCALALLGAALALGVVAEVNLARPASHTQAVPAAPAPQRPTNQSISTPAASAQASSATVSSSSAALAAATAEAAGSDPQSALAGLVQLRALAFATADPGLLAKVDVPGSSAAETDQKIAAELTKRGHRLAGLTASVSKAAPAGVGSPAPGEATAALTADVVLSGYTERDAGGKPSSSAQPAQNQHLLITLRQGSGHWLIDSVSTA